MEGVMEGTSGRLRDMTFAARYVDNGIKDIEAMLMSITGLMPDAENKDQALECANLVHQEVNEIEENTDGIKALLKSMLEASTQENVKADTAIKSMQEGIAQIEHTLRNYGYDDSQMSEQVPEIEIDDADGSISSEQCESLLDMTDNDIERSTRPSALQQDVNVLSESLAGVEITPFFRSLKSCPGSDGSASALGSPVLTKSKSFKSSVTSVPLSLTPSSKGIQIPVKHLSPSENVYGHGPYLYVSPTKHTINGTYQEERQSNVKPPRKLELPKPPVMSKTVYEFLGEIPPSDLDV